MAYTPRERRILLRELARGIANPECPRCGAACAVIRARPRDDVSYVRDRVVARCSGCRMSVGAEAGHARGGYRE